MRLRPHHPRRRGQSAGAASGVAAVYAFGSYLNQVPRKGAGEPDSNGNVLTRALQRMHLGVRAAERLQVDSAPTSPANGVFE